MSTPRTDAKQHNMGSVTNPHYVVDADDMRDLERANARLREALEMILERYVRLVESGDAGNWDAEAEPDVINARAALKGE